MVEVTFERTLMLCQEQNFVLLCGIKYVTQSIIIYQVLLSALVLKKSSLDIIQGISKLDYLLKVSYFQKYKNIELEDRKIFEDSCVGDSILGRESTTSAILRD